MRFDTLLVQSGQRPTSGAGDAVPPIHLAATYERNVQDPQRYYYGRGENPTREELEECLAALEDAGFATVFASGQAAASAVLSLLSAGQRVVSCDDVYSGTDALLALIERAGVEVHRTDLSDPGRAAEALGAGSRLDLVWIETPTNPLLKIVDLETVCRLAHDRGALVVVDNTLASPALQQPLRWADISLYSTTKSISGHLDVLGGALVYHDERLHERLRTHRTVVGNVPGALDCYLIRRGLKTLSLRVARQVESAALVLAALEDKPSVGAIHYPGLSAHPGHRIAARQMSAFGSIISFEYLGDHTKLLEQVRVFAAAVSLGGVQSLIECPASMSHAAIARQALLSRGVSENLVRLSIGIEDPVDLVADLRAALRAG
ncbi:MAG TPA: PLP-dependent aspartate aminotransferase family protein [Jatrophihabitans sp.]|jgi:cystathionine gamma-lyase|uniref:trans-sulfuration enzyme family protein n=1 Tax=Jatrophihabitans sp. TaxID=1932789 RepID=UPI002F243342